MSKRREASALQFAQRHLNFKGPLSLSRRPRRLLKQEKAIAEEFAGILRTAQGYLELRRLRTARGRHQNKQETAESNRKTSKKNLKIPSNTCLSPRHELRKGP